MTKFADQWEPNGPFGIVTDSNMSGGYRVVTNDADKTDITILPPERQKVGMLVYVTATGKTWRLTTVGVRSPGTESYSSAPVFTEVASGNIGGVVAGGTSGSVLFVDSSGFLAQDNPGLTYDSSVNTLTTDKIAIKDLTVTDAAPQIDVIQTGGGSSYINFKAQSEAQAYLKIGRINDTGVAFFETGTFGLLAGMQVFKIGSVQPLVLTVNGDGIGVVNTPQINTPNGINVDSSDGVLPLGNSTLGVTISGPATVSGVLNANGGIGISTGTSLNLGNDATITGGINIGTASASGGVAIGSGTNAVTVGGLLNANGGIGISTGTSLNLGNDATITGGISIGTVSASGGVAIGSATNNITMPGTVIVGTNLRADLDGGATLGNGGRFSTVFTQTLNASTLIAANSITVDIGTAVAKFGTVYSSRVNTDLVLSDTVALNNRSSRDGTSTINIGSESYVNLSDEGTPPLRFATGANLGQILVVELPTASSLLINQSAIASTGLAAHQLKSAVTGCADGSTLTVIWNGSMWLEVARSCA